MSRAIQRETSGAPVAPVTPARGGTARRCLMPAAFALGLILLGMLLYLPLLPDSAVQDDGEVALQHPSVAGGSGLARAPFYSGFYRPLWRPATLASYRLDWLLANPPTPRSAEGGGESEAAAAGLRRVMGRTNLLFGLGATLLALLFLWRLGAGLWSGGLLAAILLVHPSSFESILSLAGRADLIAACGVLGALLIYLRWIRPPAGAAPATRAWTAWGAWSALFAISLLGKETALLLPLFLVGYELTLGPAAGPDRSHRAGARLRGWTSSVSPAAALVPAVAGLWLVARSSVVQGWPEVFVRDAADDFVGMLDGGERLRLALFLPLHYAGLLLLLAPALPGYGYLLARPADAPPVTLGDPSTFGIAVPTPLQAALGVVALAGAALLFLLWRRRAPLAAFGLWMLATSLVAVLPLMRPNGQVASTRLLFFPLLGLLLMLLHAGRALSAPSPARPRRVPAIALLLLLAALAIGLGLRTRAVARPWESQTSLLAAFAERAPLAPEVPLARSREAIVRGDLAGAATHLEEAIGRFPRAPRTLLTLGLIRAQQGNQSLAARLFSDASIVADRLIPHSAVAARAHVSLGTLLAHQKLEDRALEEFRKAVRADSTSVEALARAGLLESISAQTAREGIRHLRRALELDRVQPTLGPSARERLEFVLSRAERYMEDSGGGGEGYDAAMGVLDSLLAAPDGGEDE